MQLVRFASETLSEDPTWSAEGRLLGAIGRLGIPVLPTAVLSRSLMAQLMLHRPTQRAILKVCKRVVGGTPAEVTHAATETRKLLRTLVAPQCIEAELRELAASLQELRLTDRGVPVLIRGNLGEVSGIIHDGATLTRLIGSYLCLGFAANELKERVDAGGSILPTLESVLVQYQPETDGLELTAFAFDPERMEGNTVTVLASLGRQQVHARFDGRSNQLLALDGSKAVDPRYLHTAARWAWRARGITLEPLEIDLLQVQGQIMVSRAEEFSLQTSTDDVYVGIHGTPAHIGRATGTVRIVEHTEDWAWVEDGDVLVLAHADAAHLAKIAGCKAVVVESGSLGSTDSKVLAQLGVPVVVGVHGAMQSLSSGMLVTVDGTAGVVSPGTVAAREVPKEKPTGVQLFLTGTDPLATASALSGHNGVLMRGEGLISLLGMHPDDLHRQGRRAEYAELLTELLCDVLAEAAGRPVLYQLHDMRQDVLSGLTSRRRHKDEPNPLLGQRGASWLLREAEWLALELEAIRAVPHDLGRSLHVVIPGVRRVQELQALLPALRRVLSEAFGKPRIWARIETPAMAARSLGRFGLTGVVIDVTQLSSLAVGTDHTNYEIGHLRQMDDPAVTELIARAVKSARHHHLKTLVVAEGEALAPGTVRAAVRAGSFALGVHPTETGIVASEVRAEVAQMVVEHLTQH